MITPAAADDAIHLSVVATSRNDDHGGFLSRRTQHFIHGLVSQCKRHGLRAELILVEWNPPPDRTPLIDELRWPADSGPCDIRILTVPPGVHRQFAHADKIRMFQMLAKNAGIRRARGKFILATNIDILFSDAVMRVLRDGLQPGFLYLTDRMDVPAEIPESDDFDAILGFCDARGFRVNAGALSVERHAAHWRWIDRLKTASSPRVGYALDLVEKFFALPASKMLNPAWVMRGICRSLRQMFVPSTNACGDFTAMSKEDWFRVRGYAEMQTFSWHLDSLLVYQALGCGIRTRRLAPAARIFHIDHGGGFAPAQAADLFKRLEDQGVPYISDDELARLRSGIAEKRSAGQDAQFNDPGWGLAAQPLPEASPRTA